MDAKTKRTTRIAKTVIADALTMVHDLEEHTSVLDPAGVVLAATDGDDATAQWKIVGLRDRDGHVTAYADDDLVEWADADDHALTAHPETYLVDVAGIATRRAYDELDISFDVVRRLAGVADAPGTVSIFGPRESLAAFGWTGRAAA